MKDIFAPVSRPISPSHNHRRDSYGGNTANRSRLLTEIVRAVREFSPGFHVSMKINSSDFTRGGLDESESLNVCKLCETSGLDSIFAARLLQHVLQDSRPQVHIQLVIKWPLISHKLMNINQETLSQWKTETRL